MAVCFVDVMVSYFFFLAVNANIWVSFLIFLWTVFQIIYKKKLLVGDLSDLELFISANWWKNVLGKKEVIGHEIQLFILHIFKICFWCCMEIMHEVVWLEIFSHVLFRSTMTFFSKGFNSYVIEGVNLINSPFWFEKFHFAMSTRLVDAA